MPTPSVLPRPLVQRVATFAVLAFCAWLALRGALKGLRPGGNDFRIYYDSARALLEGRDPLLVEGSIYPPSFDALLAPFALLPFTSALVLWQSLSFACLLWGWRRCLQMLGPALPQRPWVGWLSLLAVSRLVDSSFAYSQVNTITFALVAEALHRWRQARVVSPALAIGAGAALKVLPAGFVVWLLMRRAWRAAAACLIAILLWMSVPALIAMGPERSLRSYQHWFALVVEPAGAGGERLLRARDYVPGQSLTAACYRVFSSTPATSEGASGPRANLFDFRLETTQRIVQGLAVLHVALWAAIVLRRRRPTPLSEDPGYLLEAGLSAGMILVLGPVVQKAHMLWLLLPYVALLGLPSRLTGWRRGLRESLVCASILLIGATAP
ncbi:MAG: glycosyltransferase family 87 protein, partial [Planctomycetota bacterium]